MAADAIRGALAPFLADLGAGSAGAGARLVRALIAQLEAGGEEPLAQRLQHVLDAVREHHARDVMLAVADAVRAVLDAQHGGSRRGSDTARLPQTALDLLALDAGKQLRAARDAIDGLTDAVERDVARLRFYAGIEIDQVAALLAISDATARRTWNRVRTRLRS
jgi:DNA-directed RNA polymerase specialized sigma24 family protein